jgi:hypothetical protein
MLEIWLNARGCEHYPYFSGEWLLVYGYDPHTNTFMVWNDIYNSWSHIPVYYCEGRQRKP